MPRTVKETLADLGVMDAAQIRMSEVIYARAFFQSKYEDALARVSADLGRTLHAITLIFLASNPQELTDSIRQYLYDRDGLSDVPLTSTPDGPMVSSRKRYGADGRPVPAGAGRRENSP